MELVQSHYQNSLRAMGEALIVLGDASRAPKKAPPPSSSPPSSPSPPVVGRAIIGAIKACSQSSYGAHLAAAALERGLAESELRHSQGMEFLFANLIQPIQDRVGGPVAAAVAKCCLLGVGPLPLYELGSGGNGRGADVGPSSAAAAMSARNKYLAETLQLDEGDLAAAPELVAGAVLGRLAKLVRSFDADLGPLPLLEQEYLRAYKAAGDSATAVIKAADALSKRTTSPEAAAAAAARVLAAAGARKMDGDVMPDVLLDDANDEFNRFFEQVDAELLGNMAESFGGLADASTARVETVYSALQASMDRHHAKELRDAMMLRSLRRIAEGGGEGGAPVPVLAAIVGAYEAAVKAKLLKSAADLAAAEAGAAAAAAAAASAAAAVAAVAGPAAAAPPACTAAVPVAACNKQNKNSRNAKSTTNNKKNKNNPPNRAGCGRCCHGGARPAAAPAAPTAPMPPGFAPTEPLAYASYLQTLFCALGEFFFFLRERDNELGEKNQENNSLSFPPPSR